MRDNRKAGTRANLHQPAGEAFILMAMTLVSAALGFGLYLQFGWSLWNASLTTAVVYIAFTSAHALRRRSQAIKSLSSEIQRLEGEMHRITRPTSGTDGRAHGVGAPRPHPLAAPGPWDVAPKTAGAPRGAAPPMQAPPAAQAASTAGPDQAPVPPKADGGGQRPQPIAAPAESALSRPAAPAPAGPASQESLSQSSQSPRRDTPPEAMRAPAAVQAASAPQAASPMARFWSFRPTEKQPSAPAAPLEQRVALPTKAVPSEPAQPPVAQAPVASAPPSVDMDTGAVAGDVDIINGMIRKYAEELHPGDPEHATAATGAAALEPETLSASVDALRAAAGQMRRQTEAATMTAIERGVLPPLRPDAARGSMPPPVGPAHAQLSMLADAIERQRFDVYLAPLVGLTDRKVRHYELSLRMSGAPDSGGSALPTAARGTGLLPLVDSIRIVRAATVARYMDERSSGGSLFTSLSAESLMSDRFLSDFTATYRQAPRLRERLVLCLAQPEISGLSSGQWSAVKDISESGFRFAIEEVTTLDLNLVELKAAGFAFFRVQTQALLDGLPSLEGILPAADLCRRLGGTGLALIADGIESEDQLGRVLQAGAPVGQGPFFGLPRPVKPQALQPTRSAAA